jgi:4-carboxymuconolactone decarboxylase
MTDRNYGFAVTSESRVELPTPEAMSPAQRTIYDAVVSGPRGRMVGPLRAVIHSPDLADRWQKFGEFLRYGTVLPHKLSELAIITCGRRWNSDVEWSIHSRIAREAGLSDAVIRAIDAGNAVSFDDPAEREIYDFTRSLLHHGQVSDPAYAAIRARWGDQGVVELTGLVGYYSMVAMMVNAHLIPIPEGEGPGVTPLSAELTVLGESEHQQ